MLRPQFSLRVLLGTAIAVCVLLGTWRLLAFYGQFIEATHAAAGEPMVITGQALRPFGPQELEYRFRLTGDLSANELFGFWAISYRAKRSWFCVYNIRAIITAADLPAPGIYQLDLCLGDDEQAAASSEVAIQQTR